MKYDIIGDIHGHSNELLDLLKRMGYGLSERGHYYHPDRQAVFVGDYIDRGKYSKEVVQIVRAMQESESAIALMGNHEYNAICFHTKGNAGAYLRPHTTQNIYQHSATLTSFGNDGFLNESLDWFKQLPLYYENDYFRTVHACWDPEKLKIFNQYTAGSKLPTELIESSTVKKSPLNDAIEILLKGKEVPLPLGQSFKDSYGHIRKEVRVKWWENPKDKTYVDYAVNSFEPQTAEKLTTPIPIHFQNIIPYQTDDKPVFFGHYWLTELVPKLQNKMVCCLDYSVANKGKLVAYRYDGERELLNEKYFI